MCRTCMYVAKFDADSDVWPKCRVKMKCNRELNLVFIIAKRVFQKIASEL